MVNDTSQGMSVFTGTHYAVVQMQKERILPKGDDYTPEEAFAALYTITGNTVTMERLASSRPEGVGGAAIQEFTV